MLTNLQISSFRPSHEPTMPLTPQQREQLAALHEVLEHGDGVLRVASVGPQMVGHVFVLYRFTPVSEPLVTAWNPERPALVERLRDGPSAYVTDVLVKDGYRRLGIASALLEDAAAIARGRGCRELVLHVKVNNAPAHRLYERLRFVRLPEVADEAVEYVLSLA